MSQGDKYVGHSLLPWNTGEWACHPFLGCGEKIPVVGSSLKLAHCVVFDILYEHFLGTCWQVAKRTMLPRSFTIKMSMWQFNQPTRRASVPIWETHHILESIWDTSCLFCHQLYSTRFLWVCWARQCLYTSWHSRATVITYSLRTRIFLWCLLLSVSPYFHGNPDIKSGRFM